MQGRPVKIISKMHNNRQKTYKKAQIKHFFQFFTFFWENSCSSLLGCLWAKFQLQADSEENSRAADVRATVSQPAQHAVSWIGGKLLVNEFSSFRSHPSSTDCQPAEFTLRKIFVGWPCSLFTKIGIDCSKRVVHVEVGNNRIFGRIRSRKDPNFSKTFRNPNHYDSGMFRRLSY